LLGILNLFAHVPSILAYQCLLCPLRWYWWDDV